MAPPLQAAPRLQCARPLGVESGTSGARGGEGFGGMAAEGMCLLLAEGKIHHPWYLLCSLGILGDEQPHKYPRTIGRFYRDFPQGAHVGIGVHPCPIH